MNRLASSCLDSFSSGIIKNTAVFFFPISSNSKSVLLVRLAIPVSLNIFIVVARTENSVALVSPLANEPVAYDIFDKLPIGFCWKYKSRELNLSIVLEPCSTNKLYIEYKLTSDSSSQSSIKP